MHTCDPLYPSLTLCANLPKIVAHVNESKILAARTLMQIISSTGLPSPFSAPENGAMAGEDDNEDDDDSSADTSVEMSRLLMLQFTLDQVRFFLLVFRVLLAEIYMKTFFGGSVKIY